MVEFLEGAGLCTDTSHRRTQSRKTDPQNDHSVHHPGAHALEGPFTRSVLLMSRSPQNVFCTADEAVCACLGAISP